MTAYGKESHRARQLRRARESMHVRCGICDAPFQPGDETTYYDDEKCHEECVRNEDDRRYA